MGSPNNKENLDWNPVIRLRFVDGVKEHQNVTETFRLNEDNTYVYFIPPYAIQGELSPDEQDKQDQRFDRPLFRVDVTTGKGTAVEQYVNKVDNWLTLGKARFDAVTIK